MAHQVGTAKYEARVSKTAAEVMVALEQVHVQVEVVVAQVIGPLCCLAAFDRN